MNEDPHQHLKRFIQMCNTVKTNGVPPESYYLRLFPFSLSDKASRWLDSHAEGTFTTWDKLAEAFLQQYFPPSKTAHFRNKIISFRSIDGETLYDAWERYKELMRMCPHHNLELWQIMDTFYQGIDQRMRTLINQTAGGGLTGVPLDETYAIVEKAAQDYHLWTSDRGNPKDRKGVQDLCQTESTNDIAELTNTVKMLATEIKSLKAESGMKPAVVANVGVYCQICGSPSHYADGCPVLGHDDDSGNQEDANYVGQNNQGAGPGYRPPLNRWDNPNRNHPNLSYKPQNPAPTSFPYKQQQGNAPYQPRGQYNVQAQQTQNNTSYQSRPQYNNQSQGQQNQNLGSHSYQPQQPKQQESSNSSSMEAMMANFMAEQDRRVKALEQQLEQMAIQNRMLENQEENNLMLPAQTTRATSEQSAPHSTPAEEESSKEAEERVENSTPTVEPAPYKPPVPFPQRLKGARRDKEFMQFVDKIRTLYNTMPFTDAITQIPTYAKFMKEILTGKWKMDGTETLALSEECSAAMHQPMPPKLKDSGSFSIPCDIGGITIRCALCDLGASVSIMPYSLYAKQNLGDCWTIIV
ncbi:unnamed protein product [Rhodiola kirilowii]